MFGKAKPFISLVLLVMILAFAATQPTFAQREHPITVGADFTYIRTNVLPGCSCVDLFGGSGQLEYGLGRHLTAVADLTATHRGGITPDGYVLTQFTYTFGARYRPSLQLGRVHTFGEVLLGGAHAAGSLSPSNTGLGGANAFAFQTGGGAEIDLGRRWTLVPVHADYLLTTFSNRSDNHQNDLRLSAGVLFHFIRR